MSMMSSGSSSPFASLLRARRLDLHSHPSPPPPPSIRRRQPQADVASPGDDDSWVAVVVSIIRIVVCFTAMMVTTAVWALIMLLLLPWPYARLKQENLYGHDTGRLLIWILGNPIKIEGSEFSDTKAIYICNHASPIDIFLIMWLTPTGTVGIAKKEIIWYPLFGQLYLLANHLRIDRSNPAAAIQSMKQVARALVKNNLSLVIFPEGTRSKTGRLLPFKKGFHSHSSAVEAADSSDRSDWHPSSLEEGQPADQTGTPHSEIPPAHQNR